jgi:hypothetical protein
VSLGFLKGFTVDYATDLICSSFRVIDDPQVKGGRSVWVRCKLGGKVLVWKKGTVELLREWSIWSRRKLNEEENHVLFYVKLPSSMHGLSVTGQRCMSLAGKQFNFICPWFCSKLSRHQMFPEMRVFVTL